MRPLHRLLLALVAGALPLVAAGQRLDSIGTTATGNTVLLEPRTVRREGSRVTAAVRVRFEKAVRTREGEMRSSRTVATWDCATRQVAVSENRYYRDVQGRVLGSSRTVGLPGYATTIGGSMTAVALGHLCGGR